MHRRRPRQVPWGDLSRYADPRSQEPWQILANLHLRSADYTPPPRRTSREPPVHIGLTPTWGAAFVRYDPARGPCPSCGDAPLRPYEVCLVCHATAADATRWPMSPPPLKTRVRRRRRALSGKPVATPRITQTVKVA